jgi:hypothetical protein
MVFFDASAPYRAKVNAFNQQSFYGANQATIQLKEQERTIVPSQGGLNTTANETSHWEKENPHSSVIGDQAFMQSTSLWNTKFLEKEVNTIQYKQPPSSGYNRNHWVEHLEEIERNRVPNVIPSFNGNGNMVLIPDKNY